MATTLSVKSRDNNGVTYADPSKPDTIVRFRYSSSFKTANGAAVNNNLEEIIINDNNSISVGDIPVQDALSVRLRVSGSQGSKARLRLFLRSLAAQLAAWETENVFQGFQPTTAPVLVDPE